ncbi:V0 assembly protein 1 [Monosporozyma servazzii]
MAGKLQFLVFLLTHIVSVVFAKSATTTNSTSYISIRSKDKVDYRLSSSLDIINTATVEQPLVVFEFDKFRVIDSMTSKVEKMNQFQFLSQFFENHLTNVLDDESALDRPDSNDVAYFKIKNIEQSGSAMLYDFPVEDYAIIWFKFQKKDYDLTEVNDFIESASIFLEEYLNINIDMLINTKDTTPLENFDEAVESNQENKDHHDENNMQGSNSNKTNHGEKQDDSLSKIWTEGLIMCLLVTFLLLAILVVAMSWIMSIEISYSALDKPTNPIKKNQ